MNKRMKALSLLLSCFLIGVSCTSTDNPYDDSSVVKNVLFIMGDDHAPYVLGAYDNGIIRTPNLDRLAAEGVRFDRAYVNSPVCSPSRQSIITGKLPHATGVTLLRTPLSTDEVTIADHLKQYGYATGAIGKMHFNGDPEVLRAAGFGEEVIEKADDFHGFDYRIDRSDYHRFILENPPETPPAGMSVRPVWRPFQDPAHIWLNADALPAGVYEEHSDGTFLANESIAFLETNKGNPFCLWVSFYEPHSPFNFPVEYAGRYNPDEMPLPEVGPEDLRWIPAVFKNLTDDEKRGIVSAYYSSVEYLDSNIGRVLRALEDLDLDESTLVIYVGDHGYLMGHHGRFEKHMMWEEAVRAPLLIKNIQRFGSNRASGAMVEFIDLVPTILETLNVPPLAGAQGKSLLPLLDGETDEHRTYVFTEFLPDNKAMVRTDQWKYVFTTGQHDLAMGYATGNPPAGITHRLYDVERDPEEKTNLAGKSQYTEVLAELQQLMLQRFQDTHPKAEELPQALSVDEQLSWFCQPPDPPSTAENW